MIATQIAIMIAIPIRATIQIIAILVVSKIITSALGGIGITVDT